MKTRVLVLLLAVCGSFSGLMRADFDEASGWTVGVKVTLKDGSTQRGYSFFAPGKYGWFQQQAATGKEPYARAFKERNYPDYHQVKNGQDLIQPWLELLALDLTAPSAWASPMPMTTRVAKIDRPYSGWVGIRGSEQALAVSTLAKVELEPTLSLRQVAEGSLPLLDAEAVELLKKEPAISVALYGSGESGDFLLVYDPDLDLSSLPLEFCVEVNSQVHIGGVELCLDGQPGMKPYELPEEAESLTSAQRRAVLQLQAVARRTNTRHMVHGAYLSLSKAAQESMLRPREAALQRSLRSYLDEDDSARLTFPGIERTLLRKRVVYVHVPESD